MAAEVVDGTDTDDGKIARRWISALEACDKWQRNYMDRCNRIVRRYRNERNLYNDPTVSVGEPRRFAILWSNTETLKPAVYARTPQPVVTRRYKDADPTGRYASEVLERSLSYSMDQYEFDDHIKLALTDYLLLARGNVWVRYIPHQAADEAVPPTPEAEIEDDGPSITSTEDTPDNIPYAEVVCDHVAYNDWGMERCRSWDETGYVWRRVFMDRKALVERFGRKIGRAVPLDYKPADDPTATEEDAEKVKRAAVYEIWCKDDRKVYWVNRSFPTQCLDIKDDWLNLRGFFPCPRPLTGTLAPDSYIPVPDFVYYQDQAEEIDELTQRIATLVDGLKLIGVYAGEEQENLQNLFMQPSGTMVPIASMATFSDKGGLSKLIEWMPIEQVAATLKWCIETRKQIIDDVYQITGIADILRGMSDPRETATAQALKGNWGSLRVRDKQKELARFCRDVLRLKAEIIGGRFGVSTLKLMTDVKLFDSPQQKQIVQQAAQSGLPAPPGANTMELQAMMQRPTWEEVNGLLKNSAQRGFRVDVETDSTIEPDEQEQKQGRIEFVTTIGQLLGSSLPALQSAPQLGKLVGESVMFLARGFRVGREMEDVIEQTFEELMKNPPKELGQKAQPNDPNAVQVAQAGIQQESIKQQGAIQVQTLKNQGELIQMPVRQAEVQLEAGDQQLRAAALQRDPNPQAVSNG